MNNANHKLINVSSYATIRDSLKTGDLVMFPRLTLRDVESAPSNEKKAIKSGWRSNLVISYWQLFTNLALWWDRLWEFPHVGMVYRDTANNEILLLESLSTKDKSGKTGPRLVQFSHRVDQYPKPLLVIPTRFTPTQVGLQKLDAQMQSIRQQSYNYVGLVGALIGLGIKPDRGVIRAAFCSQLVVDVWMLLGLVSNDRIAAEFSNQKLQIRNKKLPSSATKPSQCGRAREVVDVTKAMLV
jgi:hypothetical protein